MSVFQLVRRGIPFFIFVIFCLIAAWVNHVTLLRTVANWWVISDRLDEHADAIVVLGGGIETRPDAAANLYNRDLGKKILIINSENRTLEKLAKAGVPDISIVKLDGNISSTYEETISVLEWTKENKAQEILIPTDLFHTRRVRWIFSKELDAARVKVKVVAIDQQNYSTNDWWRHKEGIAAFISECAKYIFYRLRY